MAAEWEDDSSLLAVLLDVSPTGLAHLAAIPGLGLQSLLEQLLTFLNAFTLLSDANRLAVFTAGAGGCQLAFCSPSCQPAPLMAAAGGHVAADPWPPSAAILSGLQRVVQQAAAAAEVAGVQPGAAAAAAAAAAAHGGGGSCQLSSALSRVLCFIHSMQRRAAAAQGSLLGGSGGGAPPAAERLQPARLLCLTAAPDVPSQYIGVMNAIFSAQRSGILIDACQLGAGHSSFLQQAAYLTGGTYLKPARPQALTQYLNSVFAADARSRRYLRLPGTARVDFRASCFCHKRPIDLGFVCSACLSIFCQQLPACTTCGTEFGAGDKK
ncbi:general transcription factor IIH subunit 3 [Chlorella sorokiniana]|jgi:transcription initiation factor TFIIH subunit 3|uniref:General transcription and DNA repair factor IIH subunit TFB4 n=1 Tax=Chlorella sorokiniana TaxID=3076 RepID=A0A2P6U3U1_CHLSO|nr:general transcription factor IIH subunit 3 [Chlorella sorokiniana]|eukprot:PRW60988.1 general transcription factor IIH subunit 3 [Chlorella sorokiniana]